MTYNWKSDNPMAFWSEVLKWIQGDLTREEIKTLRTAGMKVSWRCALTFFIAYSLGWLTFAGAPGFARPRDIDARIVPINAKLDTLTSTVNTQGVLQRTQTLQLLRTAIIDARAKMCHAPKSETKDIYRTQKNDAQERYRELVGSYYPEPVCSDF